MNSRKATFYIDDKHREIVNKFQTLNNLDSPSAAVRKIIELVESRPSDSEQAELILLGEILRQNTARARTSLAAAFAEIRKTREYYEGVK